MVTVAVMGYTFAASMRSYSAWVPTVADDDDAGHVLDDHHQAVVVAFEAEDHPVGADRVGIAGYRCLTSWLVFHIACSTSATQAAMGLRARSWRLLKATRRSGDHQDHPQLA